MSRPRILGSKSAANLEKKTKEIYQDREISKINEKVLDKEFNFNKYLSEKYQTKISNKNFNRVLIFDRSTYRKKNKYSSFSFGKSPYA